MLSNSLSSGKIKGQRVRCRVKSVLPSTYSPNPTGQYPQTSPNFGSQSFNQFTGQFVNGQQNPNGNPSDDFSHQTRKTFVSRNGTFEFFLTTQMSKQQKCMSNVFSYLLVSKRDTNFFEEFDSLCVIARVFESYHENYLIFETLEMFLHKKLCVDIWKVRETQKNWILILFLVCFERFLVSFISFFSFAISPKSKSSQWKNAQVWNPEPVPFGFNPRRAFLGSTEQSMIGIPVERAGSKLPQEYSDHVPVLVTHLFVR